MIPRFSPAYYKLKPIERALYLTGMPIQYVKSTPETFEFRNEQAGTKVISASVQQKVFDQFSVNSIEPGLSIFASQPTDQESLGAISHLLKIHYIKHNFKDFEYVNPIEDIPKEPNQKALYILQGCHAQDPTIVPHIRKWVRTSHGASIWLNLTGAKPYTWATEILGIKPSFIFSLKTIGQSVG